MRFTADRTETFVRLMGSAPSKELNDVTVALRTIGGDSGQAKEVRIAARRLATVTRALLKARRG